MKFVHDDYGSQCICARSFFGPWVKYTSQNRLINPVVSVLRGIVLVQGHHLHRRKVFQS